VRFRRMRGFVLEGILDPVSLDTETACKFKAVVVTIREAHRTLYSKQLTIVMR